MSKPRLRSVAALAVSLFEIDSGNTVNILAVRPQREEDYL